MLKLFITDFDAFREALSMTPWETIFVSNYDIDEVWEKWISLFFPWVNGKICKQIGEAASLENGKAQRTPTA